MLSSLSPSQTYQTSRGGLGRDKRKISFHKEKEIQMTLNRMESLSKHDDEVRILREEEEMK